MHAPLAQTCDPLQTMLHPPQLFGSVSVFASQPSAG